MSKPKIDKKINIPDQLLKQLLTASELRMLKNRFLIVKGLEEGLTIRKIAEKIKVGTDTVVRVSKMLESGDLQTKLSKVSKLPFKTKTPWIFGKND